MASTSRVLVFVVAVGAAIAAASPSEPVFRTQKERDYAVSAGLLAPEVRNHMTLAHTHSHCFGSGMESCDAHCVHIVGAAYSLHQ
jgi:hypothetical protein